MGEASQPILRLQSACLPPRLGRRVGGGRHGSPAPQGRWGLGRGCCGGLGTGVSQPGLEGGRGMERARDGAHGSRVSGVALAGEAGRGGGGWGTGRTGLQQAGQAGVGWGQCAASHLPCWSCLHSRLRGERCGR